MKTYTKKDILFAMFDIMCGPVGGQRMKADFISNCLPAMGSQMQGLDDPVSAAEFKASVAQMKKEMPAFRHWLVNTFQPSAASAAFWNERAEKPKQN